MQGVGFRPAVYRHAARLGLSGFVKNTPSGVVAEVQGESAAVDEFLRRLSAEPPRQARIDALRSEEIPLGEDGGFRILPSRRSGDLRIGIPPDLSACDDCIRELLDPRDRRYRYPFLNCTNCGPRFTIVRSLPYDRERTSMERFPMCDRCRAEYGDPSNRRFDAQPTACAACGPHLSLVGADGGVIPAADSIRLAAEHLRRGGIVALKGLGGYHLCCAAAGDGAVALLRQRKERPAKPLAVMFRSLDEVREHCRVGVEDAAALESAAAPVVVLDRLAGSTLSRLVSPDTNDVGAFLPYTPLHHLLLAEMSPLVMTSGNLAEEPIIAEESELGRVLGPIADLALVHDRPIVRRCDDSVLRMVRGQQLFLRRSRGYVPGHIPLPVSGPSVLACGAELKATVCVTRESQAFLSQHIGDLADYVGFRFYRETAEDLVRLLHVTPEIVAHDLHPDYESTRFAAAFPAGRRVGVQHHHAHVASCLAEHGVARKVIGIALDGTGYGPDGTVWGGEFLVADLRSYARAARLKTYRLPCGEEAIRHPVRMAFSVLAAEFGDAAAGLCARLLPGIREQDEPVLRAMVERGVRSPWTSRAGRLFDAASALLGLCDAASYEGQAAIRLQRAADPAVRSAYPFDLDSSREPAVLSFGPAIREIVSDLLNGADRSVIAGRFHQTVVAGAAQVCELLRERNGLKEVALSGGCLQNELLLVRMEDELHARGFTVYCHNLVPPNDGGLALGQAAVALAQAG